MQIDLSRGDWGYNNRPPREHVESVLRSLPVVSARASGPTLEIVFSRPLTASEAWRLRSALNPDLPDEIGDRQTKITLWWD